ncbi:MAG: 4Fe-4S dicluster domain-containing protein [Bacteroidales bacterium]
MNYFEKLSEDIRFVEGLKSCMNCGICSAICSASEFYNYLPRVILDTVQSKDNKRIEDLLKSDIIWYCGECMSCKTRCPRGNTTGLVIMALRSLSQDLGFFVESEKGRQQIYVKRGVGEWIVKHGYCLYLEGVGTDTHPEQGPVWDWIQDNWKPVMDRLGANYKGFGPGILRKIPEESMVELRKIFEITGGNKRFETVEKFSAIKAKEMNLEFDETMNNEYIQNVYNANNNKHCKS